jgi:hypothetical protein
LEQRGGDSAREDAIYGGLFCKIGRHNFFLSLPCGPDRWAQLVRNSVRLLNTSN